MRNNFIANLGLAQNRRLYDSHHAVKSPRHEAEKEILCCPSS